MKLGGRPAILRAMAQLHQKLVQDERFAHAQLNAPLSEREDLCEFFIFLSGGAPMYDGPPARVLFRPICADADSYDVFVAYLVDVLTGAGSPLEAELRRIMDHIRPHVLDDGGERQKNVSAGCVSTKDTARGNGNGHPTLM